MTVKILAKVFLRTILIVLVLLPIAMWLRSEFIKYDLVWFWVRPDCRVILNSHCGTLYVYTERIASRGSTDGCMPGDDHLGHWSLETHSTTVAWDYPNFERIIFRGISVGSNTFLADAATTQAGLGISYWFLILIFVLPLIGLLGRWWFLKRKRSTVP